MKPIHKLNGGNGATLCNICYGMISTGWTDDVMCNHCKGYKDLGKFTLKEIKEMTYKDFGIKKNSNQNISNLNK